MKFSIRRPPDEIADHASHHGPCDTEPRREPESERNRARKNPAGEHADDQADDYRPDNAHNAHGPSSVDRGGLSLQTREPTCDSIRCIAPGSIAPGRCIYGDGGA